LAAKGWGEALATEVKQAGPPVAKPALESPASAEQLMEEVCDRENLKRAAWEKFEETREVVAWMG